MDSTRVCAVQPDVRRDELCNDRHRFATTSVGCATGDLLVDSRSGILETPDYFSTQFDDSPAGDHGSVFVYIFLADVHRTLMDDCSESCLFLRRCARLSHSHSSPATRHETSHGVLFLVFSWWGLVLCFVIFSFVLNSYFY